MTTALRASASGFEMGGNKINSSDRFIREVSNPANKTLNMCRGPSIETNRVTFSGDYLFGFRWRVNDATATGLSFNFTNNGGSAPDGFNTGIDGAV